MHLTVALKYGVVLMVCFDRSQNVESLLVQLLLLWQKCL